MAPFDFGPSSVSSADGLHLLHVHQTSSFCRLSFSQKLNTENSSQFFFYGFLQSIFVVIHFFLIHFCCYTLLIAIGIGGVAQFLIKRNSPPKILSEIKWQPQQLC